MRLKETINNRFTTASRNEELGFTDKYEKRNQRVLNKNGNFSVIRKGVKTGIFHKLLTMSWWRFSFFVLAFYSLANLFFAFLYLVIDYNGVGYTSDYQVHDRFLMAFFFSAQTITTVGYGSLYPLSWLISLLAATEALIGLMSFAIFTGVMYGRFSRPVHGIRFSDSAVIAPYKGGYSFQFRVGNEMTNNLINLEAKALLSIVVTEGEKQIRRFQPITLENNRINYLSLNWTCVHPINDQSPLFGLTEQDFMAGNIEIIVMVEGFNDAYAQVVHARSSYTWDEIEWNKKFELPYYFDEAGLTVFDIDKLGITAPVAQQVAAAN
ncbi:MAG: ion channel [Chitinophagales bacterium]